LEAFGAPLYLELHFRAFFQSPITRHLDGGEVHEHILAAGTLDKSVALRGVKPFHDTLFSHYLSSPVPFPASRDVPSKLRLLSHVIYLAAKGNKRVCRKLQRTVTGAAFEWSTMTVIGLFQSGVSADRCERL